MGCPRTEPIPISLRWNKAHKGPIPTVPMQRGNLLALQSIPSVAQWKSDALDNPSRGTSWFTFGDYP